MADAVALGVQAAQAQRPGEAARWFRIAAAEKPNDARIHSWLGQALCADGAFLEGVGALQAAGMMLARGPNPQSRAPAIAIAAELQRLTAIEESLTVIDALLRVEPANAPAAYLRATALAQLNRPTEALEAGEHAARLAPANPGVALLLASLEHDTRRDDAAEARLRALLAGQLPPREAHRARKLLAAILDRHGAYAEAFAELTIAEQLAPKVPELAALDRRIVTATIAEASAGYTAELMARWRGHRFTGRAAPLFVVGFFRSGTTMMQQILGSHPDAFVADEAPLVDAALRTLVEIDPSRQPIPAKLAALEADGIQRLRDAYWAAAGKRFGDDALDARVFIDKFTMNTVNLGFIGTIFPDAKLVFMLRDPRDVCLSAYMQQMPPGTSTAALLGWQGTADFYAATMRWWLDVRDKLSLGWHQVRYEDLVDDLEDTMRPVLALAGLDWDAALARFHERGTGRFISTPSRSQVTQPLYRTAVARWRRYAREIEPIAPALAPFVEAFGYTA